VHGYQVRLATTIGSPIFRPTSFIVKWHWEGLNRTISPLRSNGQCGQPGVEWVGAVARGSGDTMNTKHLSSETDTIDTRDWPWPLWGTAAGILGAVGHLFSLQRPSEAEVASGAGVIAALERGPYHVGIVTGLTGVFCLLVFAAGWRRWAAVAAPASLAGGTITLALTASAGAMMLAYGFKGALAIYLTDGMDEGTYPAESLLTFFMIDDFGAFISWWGVAMAAAAIAWMALRERSLPLWIGIVSVLVVLVPVAAVGITGLPGVPGLIEPFYLVILGPALALTFRRAGARVAPDSATSVAGVRAAQQA